MGMEMRSEIGSSSQIQMETGMGLGSRSPRARRWERPRVKY
jgi:hypothetical protein